MGSVNVAPAVNGAGLPRPEGKGDFAPIDNLLRHWPPPLRTFCLQSCIQFHVIKKGEQRKRRRKRHFLCEEGNSNKKCGKEEEEKTAAGLLSSLCNEWRNCHVVTVQIPVYRKLTKLQFFLSIRFRS